MNLDSVVEKNNRECGLGTMFSGGRLRPCPKRLPTGIFAVDFISAGGLPIHASSCFWGGDGGAKTFIAIHAMKAASLLCWRCFNYSHVCTCKNKSPLLMKTSWIDIEGTLERDWVEKIKVHPDCYYIGLADYGEQGIDLAMSSLSADDCGLVVVDSLGALTPIREMDGSVEDSSMGVNASIVTKAVKKIKQQMIRERKRKHPCTVLFINQMRADLGKTFGSKEGQSGGFAMKHEFSLLFRCGKKSLNEGQVKKYDDKERGKKLATCHTISVYKDKVFTLKKSSEFTIIKEDMPLYGLSAGDVDDFTTILLYAKEYGILKKSGTGWVIGGTEYHTQNDVKDYFKSNPNDFLVIKKAIVDAAIYSVRHKVSSSEENGQNIVEE